MRWTRAWLAALGLGAVLACGGLGPPPLARPPSDADRSLAAGWLAGDLPEDPACEHGGAWVVVALEGGPGQRAAGWEALRGCDHPDRAVLAAPAVLDPEPAVAGAALRLAGDLFGADAGDLALAEAVGQALLTHPSMPVRYEAVEALDRYPWTGQPTLEAAMLGALGDDQPPVVAEVLERATFRAAGLAEPAPWRATAYYAALGHLDPGIRGQSLLLLARLASSDASARVVIRGALRDKHAYTRSAAAQALVDLGDLGAVHLLVERLDDEAPNGWVMLPWESTDGRPQRQIFVGSHFERVDDAALRAIARLSEPLGDDAFALRDMSLKYLKLDLISARREAEAWYEAHRDALPPP